MNSSARHRHALDQRRDHPIDFLCGDGLSAFDPDEREPLEISLAAAKPLAASQVEECRELLEIKRLIPRHQLNSNGKGQAQ